MFKKVYLPVLILITILICPSQLQAAKDSGDVAAKIDKDVITMSELNKAAESDLMPLASQIYDIKKKRLDQMVEDKLYELEAKKQKTSVEALKAEINKGDEDMSDDAIEVYYDLNKAQFGNRPLEQVKAQIKNLLIRRKLDKSNDEFLAGLRKKYNVEVMLEEPKMELDIDGYPSRGPDNAKVTVVEFTDFQCPFCKRFKDTIDQLVEEYPNDVKHVFHHLPLPMHRNAKGAHHASVCADRQGKFWEMREVLFNNATALERENLNKYAGEVGLDMDAFSKCMEDPEIDKYLDDAASYAQSVGARGTPTSFVNGTLFRGAQPYEQLKQVVETKLK
ncbi:MAG: hypothetical protein COV74_07860 [Candidatus Omnitrophica bacterium CG11_big_fil_rev_8_21_14_0_20_45_26]|uniref:Thioredoxin domain-containing protein n=1 Tax=Candidatus Abzuiibacterium crystallinum TaxID=1974748 RepID=A0A2H0LMP4_9BACT|nr:MAG: hypothetical protein COV74_07860 [Candidatus Omnitrophica bacterium CG11_big_fil_rev_8_21_14_0_20_45_26]PIW65137.1 MAG: hypothetical protein COW12_02900 [Candidatus Omnitrophica bacterium CG12_big_fil_rev_8_21_14_0_65_45_16]